jgi:hypothetical protein
MQRRIHTVIQTALMTSLYRSEILASTNVERYVYYRAVVTKVSRDRNKGESVSPDLADIPNLESEQRR